MADFDIKRTLNVLETANRCVAVAILVVYTDTSSPYWNEGKGMSGDRFC